MTAWQFLAFMGLALLTWPVTAFARRYRRGRRHIVVPFTVEFRPRPKPRVRVRADGWVRHQGGPFPFDPKCRLQVMLFGGVVLGGSRPQPASETPDEWWRGLAKNPEHDVAFYKIVQAPDTPKPGRWS